jgi:NADPH:quinone reductase-like Zn-dependent oxidoreductase
MDKKRAHFSIVAGSSSTGQFLIQLSRLLGLRVICTSSPANNELLRDLGAEAVIDRELPIVEKVEKIRSITGQNVSQTSRDGH